VSGALGDDSEEADAGGNSMWHLYAEYGRDNAFKGVLGMLGTVLARFLGLIPAFVLGLAIDGIFLDQRAFALPLVPGEWVPGTADGQLVLAIGLIVGATVLGAAVSWAQNWGWNAFAQNIQHALRVDTYEAMQALDMGFFDEKQTGELLSILNNDVNQLESFLNGGVSSALRIGSMIVGIGAIMVAMNP
jgi:ATP-binding cassette subfamily B protein